MYLLWLSFPEVEDVSRDFQLQVEWLQGVLERKKLEVEWDGRDPFSFPQDWRVLLLLSVFVAHEWDVFSRIYGKEVRHRWDVVGAVFGSSLVHSWRVLPLIPATFSEDVHRPVAVVEKTP